MDNVCLPASNLCVDLGTFVGIIIVVCMTIVMVIAAVYNIRTMHNYAEDNTKEKIEKDKPLVDGDILPLSIKLNPFSAVLFVTDAIKDEFNTILEITMPKGCTYLSHSVSSLSDNWSENTEMWITYKEESTGKIFSRSYNFDGQDICEDYAIHLQTLCFKNS